MLTAPNIRKIVYGAFGVFVIVYFLSAFMSPVDPEVLEQYRITTFQLRLLSAAILAPVVGIWACAAYGFVHFKQYALSIKGSPPGKGINTLANGLGIIALQLLINGAFSVMTSIEDVKLAMGGDRGTTLISSCIDVTFALAAMFIIYRGADQLYTVLPKPSKNKPEILTKSFYLLGLLSVGYVVSIIVKYPAVTDVEVIYSHVPLGAALLLIALPYVISWNFALQSVKLLHAYRDKVSGVVYKQALGILTTGLYMILGSSVLLQLLSTQSNAFANLQLLPLIIIVYALIVLIGIGYLYIAKSAKRLRHVES